jgi:hypothetical protein
VYDSAEHCPGCAVECVLDSASVNTNTFCNDRFAPTAMYMGGFVPSGNALEACPVLWFDGWTLDSRGKVRHNCTVTP